MKRLLLPLLAAFALPTASIANQKILDLDKNFINQVDNDNTKMLGTFDALQTIVVNLKTDMLSLFNVAVDYTDADGD